MNIEYIKRNFKFFSEMSNLESIGRQQDNKENKAFLRNNNYYYCLSINSEHETNML